MIVKWDISNKTLTLISNVCNVKKIAIIVMIITTVIHAKLNLLIKTVGVKIIAIKDIILVTSTINAF